MADAGRSFENPLLVDRVFLNRSSEVFTCGSESCENEVAGENRDREETFFLSRARR